MDPHVHLREPGATESETVASGLAAAARGGFAAVVAMPNTTPPGDSVDWVRRQLAAGAAPGGTRLFPSACITRGRSGAEVADIEALAGAGAAFFTDDGSFVENTAVMERAMKRIAALGMVVCQHAMTPTCGVIRDCALARRLNLPVVTATVETDAIRRDISLCRETGCRLHVQHISTAEGVSLVRGAQGEGLPVTAEATPHHLLFTCDDLAEDDAVFKMAPPLGNREDRAELRKAVKDGVLMFATDHAPHSAAKKEGGFRKAANGVIGLETAVPATYAVMVEEEGMSVEKWAEAWWKMPRRIIRGVDGRDLAETRVAVGSPRAVDPAAFASLSRNCPFRGMEFKCWPVTAGRKGEAP